MSDTWSGVELRHLAALRAVAEEGSFRAAAHGCTGGPSKPTRGNSSFWTCGGAPATIRFNTTAGNQRRVTSAAIFSQQWQPVGVKANAGFEPANPNFFGRRLPNADFDVAEFAWLGGPDPSGFDAIYQCVNNATNNGGQNYKNYCNKQVDALLTKGEADLNPTSRTATYQAAAKIVAHDNRRDPAVQLAPDRGLQVRDQGHAEQQHPDPALSHVEHRAAALLPTAPSRADRNGGSTFCGALLGQAATGLRGGSGVQRRERDDRMLTYILRRILSAGARL